MQIFTDSIFQPANKIRSKLYTPNFSGLPLELTWCHQFGQQLLPKSGNPDSLPPQQAIFDLRLILAKLSTFAYIMSYKLGKLWHKGIIWDISEHFCFHGYLSKNNKQRQQGGKRNVWYMSYSDAIIKFCILTYLSYSILLFPLPSLT